MMSTATTTPIAIAYPAYDDLHLRISVGACRLRLMPGDAEPWVSGEYVDPAGALPCRLSQEGGQVRISQGTEVSQMLGLLSHAPRLDLRLGLGRPFALTIETGASQSDLHLGSVPLSALTLQLGAGEADLDFAVPNPAPMSRLAITTGASEVEADHLGNANSAEVRVDGGAASLELDFQGDWRRACQASVSTGLASVQVRLPAALAAHVTADATLGSLNAGAGFTTVERGFLTPPAAAGGEPMLTLAVRVALGAVDLRLV
jgi:hypothetical protein